MRFAPLVAAAALVLPTALAGTCPNNPLAHCYPTACQGTTAVDIVFVIDMSASMSTYIKGTVNALNGFVSTINNNAALDAKYGIYTFGIADSLGSKAAQPNPQPAQYTALQTGAAVQTSLNALVSQTSGSIENGLVAVTTAANNYAWRTGSVKNIFLLTNEDSDPDFALKSSDFDAYYYPTTYNALPSAHPWADWQAEIDAAANAVIAKNISLYMSVLTYNDLGSNGGLLTPLQYGEPASTVQSQNSTFGDFSAATTLNNIKARYFSKSCSQNCVSTTSTGVSLANSLQAQVLASQIRGNALTARVFDLAQVTSNTKFFNNIFSALQSNIDVCSSCYQYSCAADGVTCGTPKYICDCAGKPLGTSTIDCAGVCGGTSQIDVCTGVCSKTANLNPAKCTCPSLTYDPCGNCNTAAGWNTTSTQFCIQNCKGQWVNATDLNTFNDDCGVKCGNNNAKDLCGVCFGNNTKVVYANDGPCACFVNPVTCPGSGYTMCHIPDSARLSDGSINTTAICPVITGCDLTANNYVCGQCYSKTTDNSTIYDNCGYCKNLNATCVQDCKGVYGGGAKTDQCGNCQEPGVVDPNCVLDCTGNYTTNVTVALDCNYKCVSLSQVSKANCTTVIAIPPTSNPPNNTPAIVGGVVGGLAAVAAVAGLLFYLHRSGVLGAASKQVDMGASSQNPLYSSATQVQSNPLYAS